VQATADCSGQPSVYLRGLLVAAASDLEKPGHAPKRPSMEEALVGAPAGGPVLRE
jgi:hypothetical protein